MKQKFKKEYFSTMNLVTGGTGLVGAHLMYFLLEDGQKVRAIHRKTSDLKAVLQVFGYYTSEAQNLFDKIEWVEANLNDIPALTKAFLDIEYVYHAAAYVTFDPKNFGKLQKSNIEGTANVVNLCLAFGIIKLCHVSSIAAIGKSESEPIHEEMPWNPDDDNNVYAISKYGAEMEVWRGTQEGLDAVIVNPGVIIGSGLWNKGTGIMFKRVHKGLNHYTTGEMGFVDVVDVVKTMIALMKNPIKNERFIIVAEDTSYKILLSKIAEAFGKKPPKKELKLWMLLLAVKMDAFISFVTRRKQMLFESTSKALVTKRKYNNTKIKETLNYKFRTLDETVTEIVKNFRKDIP
jgi:dihydroflavonol-4-reductase